MVIYLWVFFHIFHEECRIIFKNTTNHSFSVLMQKDTSALEHFWALRWWKLLQSTLPLYCTVFFSNKIINRISICFINITCVVSNAYTSFLYGMLCMYADRLMIRWTPCSRRKAILLFLFRFLIHGKVNKLILNISVKYLFHMW